MKSELIALTALALLATGCAANSATQKSAGSTGDQGAFFEQCTGEVDFNKVSDVPTVANPKGILAHGLLTCVNSGPRKLDAALGKTTTLSIASPCKIELTYLSIYDGKATIACADGKVANGPLRSFVPGGNGSLDAKTDAGEEIAFYFSINLP